jgi:dihydrofolate reductase
MRQLIVSMNVTMDGFMAGANCELDWHFDYWDEEMAGSLSDQLSDSDTILLGRITYQAMAGYWPSKALNPGRPGEDLAFAHMMNNYQKIVFSNTLTKTDWHNSRILKGNIAEETARLKQEPGKNIIVYGSGDIVAALVGSGLIDEYRLWVHPVILGKGRRLFRNLRDQIRMKLISIKTFNSGVAILYYRTGGE